MNLLCQTTCQLITINETSLFEKILKTTLNVHSIDFECAITNVV